MTLEFSLTLPPSPVSRPRVCGGWGEGVEWWGVVVVCTPKRGDREEAEKPLPLKPAVTASRETTHQPRAVAGAAGRQVLFTPTAATALANRYSVTRPLRHSSPGFPVRGLLTSRDASDGPASLAH